jgi:hypothetical protein
MTKKTLLATALTTVLSVTTGAYATDPIKEAFNAAMKDAVICANVLAETTYEKTKKAESPELEALSDAIYTPCGTVLVMKEGTKETDPVTPMNPDKIVTVQPMGSSEACFTALNTAVTNAAIALPKEKNASCLSAVEKLKAYKEKSATTTDSKTGSDKNVSGKEDTKETVKITPPVVGNKSN